MKRRQFLKSGGAFATVTILPSSIWAKAPNSKLRTAHIGVGGMGGEDLNSIASHPKVEVAALCDVDRIQLEKKMALYPNARVFSDYRELFSVMGDSIDAVQVSTPDHTHAPASMMAMNLGKPVYCQKPLTHEVFESRQMRLLAEKKGLPTQMGIQIHSRAVYRKSVQMIQEGVIGKVKRVHAWSNKNWGYNGPAFAGSDPVPESLNWDLWLGTAKERPYKEEVYHPAQWRKLIDFGCGTLGDMGIHIFDTPYTALELTEPLWVRTTCREPNGIGHPEKNKVEYLFTGTKYTMGEMRWTWYDGVDAPESNRDLKMPDDIKLPQQGAMFVGEGGRMLLPHYDDPIVFDKNTVRKVTLPALDDIDHYHQWVDACLGEGKCSAPFSLAGKLSEAMLLGVVANRFPGKKLKWDAASMKITNMEEANHLLKRNYRDGFQVEGLT